MPKTILEMVAEIVDGQSSQRTLSGSEIQTLVNDTYQAFKRIERLELQGKQLAEGDSSREIQGDERSMHSYQEQSIIAPAIDPRESIGEHTIICLECGCKEFRQITHTHLRREHGLSPDEYRRKYNIPSKQPLVATSVTNRRKALAREQNVGEKLKAARSAARSGKNAMATDEVKEVTE